MQARPFVRFETTLKKLAAARRETLRLEDVTDVRAADIMVAREPYSHIVVDQFFKPGFYAALSGAFNEMRARGFSEKKSHDTDRLHRFDVDYDGYVYTPEGRLDSADPLSIFYTVQWNRFISRIFNQETGLETDFNIHHHPPGDRTGFVHHDFADKLFTLEGRLENGVVWNQGRGAHLARRRIISLIYFLNNDGWQEGDGGETGLYAPDKTTLLKKVAPINNRLFAFRIGPESMHAFQENKKERNSFIQWFHIAPELLP